MSDEFDNPSDAQDIRISERARMTLIEKTFVGIVAIPFWVACGWLMIFSVPRAERLFADFRMRLPLMAEFVIAWGWLAVPAVLLVACMVGLILQRRWAIYLSFVVIPAILSTLVFISIYVPIRELTEALGGNNNDVWAIFWG